VQHTAAINHDAAPFWRQRTVSSNVGAQTILTNYGTRKKSQHLDAAEAALSFCHQIVYDGGAPIIHNKHVLHCFTTMAKCKYSIPFLKNFGLLNLLLPIG
jgi:hypothetical protein